jgi:hypothetical protein
MRILPLLGIVKSIGLLTAALGGILPNPASACSPPPPVTTTAMPGTGATEVSPMSSIFLVTARTTIPALVLEENGVAMLGSPRIELLGSGELGYQRGTFWKVVPEIDHTRTTSLLPASSYVLKVVDAGVETKLTEFSTATAYDKQPAQPPVLTELRLWRVHYSDDQIGGGSCVFSEYVSYVDLDYQEGSVPGTPAEEVVAVIQLTSTKDYAIHSFVFAGGHFEGVMDGLGGIPHAGVWNPTLAPDAEYCAVMTIYGRNDRAMENIYSNQICAKVQNVDAIGSSFGCSLHGRPATSALVPVALALLGLLLVRRRRGRVRYCTR